MGDNSFEGSVPDALYSFKDLRWADFSTNRFSGTLFASIGNSSNLLMGFTFQQNRLSGTFPRSLERLNALNELRLSSNLLTGTLPSEIGKLFNLGWLYLGNNKLTGTLPSKMAKMAMLQALVLQENQFRGKVPLEFLNLESLGKFILCCTHIAWSSIFRWSCCCYCSLVLAIVGHIFRQQPKVWHKYPSLHFLCSHIPWIMSCAKIDLLLLHNNSFSGDISFLCVNNQTINIVSDCGVDKSEVLCGGCCNACCTDNQKDDGPFYGCYPEWVHKCLLNKWTQHT